MKPVTPPMRGWKGRGAGAHTYVPRIHRWRGTSVQVCGLWPFAAGSGTPMVGVPFGLNQEAGRVQTVCFDPISWFRKGIISNPSMFVLGLPGLGKSSAVRHLVTGLAGYGVNTMVLGDLKPDYADLVRALGGQVLEVGRGRGTINPLDTGLAKQAAAKLSDKAAHELMEDARGRQKNMVEALLQLTRGTAPGVVERNVVSEALRLCEERMSATPTLDDLLKVIREGPESLRNAAIDRGDIDRYREVTEQLDATLESILKGYGGVFSGQTSSPMDMDRPVVFDISSAGETDGTLVAGVLLACWSYGFGNINIANTLADEGLAVRRNYFIVLDELWRILAAGENMAARINALTRLNRQWGVGQAMITHTPSDLEALATEKERAQARGFIDRSGVALLGGLPEADVTMLDRTQLRLTRKEKDTLISWADSPGWDSTGADAAIPPGRGMFLIKAGQHPGIPVEVVLTQSELDLSDTNKRWSMANR